MIYLYNIRNEAHGYLRIGLTDRPARITACHATFVNTLELPANGWETPEFEAMNSITPDRAEAARVLVHNVIVAGGWCACPETDLYALPEVMALHEHRHMVIHATHAPVRVVQ